MSTQLSDIYDACRTGDIDKIKIILNAFPEAVKVQDAKGFSPLMLAVYNGQEEATEFLLKSGADADQPDASGNTPLMGVCFKGYTSIGQKLIEAGADVNKQNFQGATALTFAATFGQVKIAEMLLEKGAKKDIKDQRGMSPENHAKMQGHPGMVKLFGL
ncbi:ankyrin repeat domain-containing protein [Chondrinema litorale]|uniref:ankyrin repeat domain-containing protein n=1 Tax=Chondrinema litorale TaxID=2994555 RepID=UPI002542D878|nr:ankyrin repeat domain-containing protein [Chondrinema litorale]UZR93925.1 ankyrin repeat domain-containing protein [Chondrinema litorale]